MNAAEKLSAAKALIADPKDWSATGLQRHTGRYCAIEAMLEAGADPFYGPGDFWHKAKKELYPDYPTGYSIFNQVEGHPAVMAVYDRAIALAEASDA